MKSRRFTRPLRSTRMPGYQMSYVGTKATVASQNAEAHDVGCGSRAAIRTKLLLSQVPVCSAPVSGHAVDGYLQWRRHFQTEARPYLQLSPFPLPVKVTFTFYLRPQGPHSPE